MAFNPGGGGGGGSIAGASDVSLDSVQNDQALMFDASSSKWQNDSVEDRIGAVVTQGIGTSVDYNQTAKQVTVGVATPVTMVIRYSNGWPDRSTLTDSATRTVFWLGPDATPPTVGGEGMGDNDIFFGKP